MLASVGFVKEDGVNILGIKIGEVAGNKDMSDLAVLYCLSSDVAETICNLLGQCFQLVFSEATMQFFDKKVVEGASQANPFGQNQSVSSHARSSFTPEGPSFISGSRTELNKMNTSYSRKLSSTTHSGSDRDSSQAAADLIQEYMRMLHALLSAEELKQFAVLLKRWRSDSLPLSEFTQKILELYGSERKHLLARMRPFIPEKEMSFFDTFLELSGITDNAESSLASCSPASDSNYSRSMDLSASGEFNSVRLMLVPPVPPAVFPPPADIGDYEMNEMSENVHRLQLSSSGSNLEHTM